MHSLPASQATGLTTVLVIHHQDEALELALISTGRIEQVGQASDIRSRPASQFVREFIAV